MLEEEAGIMLVRGICAFAIMPALISGGMRGIDTIEFGGGMLAEFAAAMPVIGIVTLAGNVPAIDIGVLCVVLVLPGVDVGLAALDGPPSSVGLGGSLASKVDRKPSIAEEIAVVTDSARLFDSSSSPVMDCGDVVMPRAPSSVLLARHNGAFQERCPSLLVSAQCRCPLN